MVGENLKQTITPLGGALASLKAIRTNTWS
jgi:hypothetical protein